MHEDAAVEALTAVLQRLNIPLLASGADSHADVLVDLDGSRLALELKHYALVDVPRAAQLLHAEDLSQRSRGSRLVVVGDRVVAGARDMLRDAGQSWLDLRGHLYLNAPGLRIDVTTPALAERSATTGWPSGRVGLATAVDILLHRPDHVAVREIARRIKAAPSSVSRVIRGLREEGLLDERSRPDLRELFWAAAPRWRPDWVPVERHPLPSEAVNHPLLGLSLDEPSQAGWALTGDVAAAHLGAPIGLPTGAPLDFYLPSRVGHRRAVAILGENRTTPTPAARVAVAPIPAACEHRVDVASWRDEHWLLTRSLFVGLDLARDPGRGREILDAWEPAAGGPRVW